MVQHLSICFRNVLGWILTAASLLGISELIMTTSIAVANDPICTIYAIYSCKLQALNAEPSSLKS